MSVKSAPFFARNMGAKPVSLMGNPDEIVPVLVDRETLFRLMADQTVAMQPKSL